MDSERDYQLGLLYLVHLFMNADKVIDERELSLLQKIKHKEQISDLIFDEFQVEIRQSNDSEVYKKGIELINRCTDSKKLDAFAYLYKMIEIDGNVHIKEVKLLLHSIKMAKIEFDDVVAKAKQLTNY